MTYGLFIPTRDSGGWIEKLLFSYREIDLNPFFLVDSRSIDNTLDILEKNSANFDVYTPSDDFVEAGMIEFGASRINADWALRLDDDEFPSRALVAALDRLCSHPTYDAWYISRREVFFNNCSFVYSNWPSRIQYFINKSQQPGMIKLLQPFPRLFKTKKVQFVNTVHSPGFIVPDNVGYVEPDCFFVHFQGILRTVHQRLEKVRKYAKAGKAVGAWSVVDEYLPEYLDFDLYDLSSEGLEEFTDLFISVNLSNFTFLPQLTEEEKELMGMELLRASLNSHKSFDHKFDLVGNEIAAWEKFDETIFRFTPKILTKKLAEAMITLGRITGRESFQCIGNLLWQINQFRSARAFK